MNLQNFFFKNPVFTLDEIRQFALTKANTLKALLRYYLNKQKIIRIKRGLYATVPVGSEAANFVADPYLVAAKLAPDAVISHHTALAFYGHTYSMASRFIYSTNCEIKKLDFQNCTYWSALFPKRLRETHQEQFLVKQETHLGTTISVTAYERILVDLLDRPDLGFGWEEIWRSLESVKYFDIAKVVDYTLLLNNATTLAKVGFFLEQHRESFMVENHFLQTLEKGIPKQPHYMDKRQRQLCQLQKRWNLIVPNTILEKSWEEPL